MYCQLCSNPQLEEYAVLKKGRVFKHCNNCDLVMLDMDFWLDHIAEKQRYDQHENSLENKGYVEMLNKFIDTHIKPYIKEDDLLLDYGSGPNPVLSKLLNKQGIKTEIYDPYYAPRAFSDEEYDLILSTEVVEHFNYPGIEIPKMIKRLKKGGYLVLMTAFRVEQDQFKAWYYKDDHTHVSFYSLKTFDFITKEYGLEIVEHNDKDVIILRKL